MLWVAWTSLAFAIVSSIALPSGWIGTASASTSVTPSLARAIDYAAGTGWYNFTAVSCASSSQCTATANGGSYFVAESNGVFPSPSVGPVSGTYYGISCATASDCTAVGQDGTSPIYATETNGTWGPGTVIQASGGGVFKSVSCTSATNCTAVGFAGGGPGHPMYVVEKNGVWPSSVSELSGAGVLESVSCVSVGNCVSVGSEIQGRSLYAIEKNGHWPKSVTFYLGVGLNSVSCVGAHCTAVGQFRNGEMAYAREAYGGWSKPAALSGPYFDAQSVSCSAERTCVAVGFGGSQGNQPMYAIEQNGPWGKVRIESGPTAQSGSFYAVSCVRNTTHCLAVGADGNQAPMYAFRAH